MTEVDRELLTKIAQLYGFDIKFHFDACLRVYPDKSINGWNPLWYPADNMQLQADFKISVNYGDLVCVHRLDTPEMESLYQQIQPCDDVPSIVRRLVCRCAAFLSEVK